MAGSGAVDQFGNAYVAGSTYSTDFPTVNPTQAANAGGSDAFAAKLNAAGSALLYSSYLGGSGDEDWSGNGASLGVDTAGNIYVYRSTTSTNFPTVNPLQAGRDSKCIQDRDVDQSRQRGSDYRKYHVHGLRGVFSEP